MANNKSNRPTRRRALLGTLAVLSWLPAHATPLPPSSFVYTVSSGNSAQCTAGAQATDGICDYTSANGEAGGTAQDSGGIAGTPGYNGNSGTSVSASATNGQVPPVTGPGANIRSVSVMDYYFTVTGPGNAIPITVISQGLAELTGNGDATAELTIRNEGTTPPASPPLLGGTPIYRESAGVHDDDRDLTTLDQTWNQSANLCVTAGDYYLVQIVAIADSNGVQGNALASVDPRIKIDPPPPQNCPLQGPLSAYGLNVSSGASTGFPATVPEPGTFLLAVLGLGLLGLARYSTRR